jgi:hypothetical protein
MKFRYRIEVLIEVLNGRLSVVEDKEAIVAVKLKYQLGKSQTALLVEDVYCQSKEVQHRCLFYFNVIVCVHYYLSSPSVVQGVKCKTSVFHAKTNR